ncbi:DNA mismatch repair protein MutS [Fictibacillus aquaticus]|uniref:DNA mismatch repair protein MutS n=1 Tax=Fictibacillus aquaticus TaxID=2021314 RepID=A0A235FBQ5_9BACL|nr:DNA mismatch repair protein MutS [Fictibacillus aquaticus]OYD58778.1 DNA mismatch repair protein MutS [Fictibacillus aquaticus]
MSQYTPMIQQYLSVKANHQDAFLFFRLGDFYEMFFDDALNASRILEITLTSRDGGSSDRIPMCGVPYHSAPGYIKRLVADGYKVAICEQVEDPRQAKGVVRREVVQIITPGTVMDDQLLSDRDNNYIGSLALGEKGEYALVIADLSTGEAKGYLRKAEKSGILADFSRHRVKEAVLDSSTYSEWKDSIHNSQEFTASSEDRDEIPDGFSGHVSHLNHHLLHKAAGRLFQYLKHTQKRSLGHMRPVIVQSDDVLMKLDAFSKRNLELVETNRTKGKKGSLLWLLDKTMTSMGARKLKQWLEEPLFIRSLVKQRLDTVEALYSKFFEREEIRQQLKNVYDMERLAAKVAFGNASPRDLLQLKLSLQNVPAIKAQLSQLDCAGSEELLMKMDEHTELADYLERAVHENAPLLLKEGNIIKEGFSAELDEYRDASVNGKAWIASLEQKEREATGIRSLKIGYNKIFGYFIEVTRSNLGGVPSERYERKQTLSNAERFVTPELKEKERLILEAEEKMAGLEHALFLEIRSHVKNYVPGLQQLAGSLAELDVLQSFASVSEERRFVKPVISESGQVRIQGGRHPVVEKVMDAQEYVANDITLDNNHSMLLITGPNMAGKSTYMRQLALTAIMMQVGCFVPADSAELPLFDQIFTRIGAADDLVGGQSTFMVEMLETNYAIRNATADSLILLDEIGRGTSTYDGMALAHSIIEHIHDHIGAKTLFSTHYHELTILSETLPSLKNVHVSAVEEDGRLVFLHKIVDGHADQSFGIQVAELADLPAPLIKRAKHILGDLEKNGKEPVQVIKETAAALEQPESQLSLFESPVQPAGKTAKKSDSIIAMITSLNLLEMTPLDAMNKLYELQKKAR